MHLHILFSLLGSAFAQVQPISNTTSPLLTVNTTSGIYTGFVDPSLPQVHQWHGVPFATPPTSNLRFLPAIKAPYQSGGPHPATSYKPICIQNSHNTSGVFWTLVPEFQNTDPQSEDCLYLNIWAPRTPAVSGKKVPVLIWVVGGGFQEGGGHAPYQVPDRWIERTQSHIVVTFNYRLNVFGFPAAAGSVSNPGLTDIRLVVEWVRDNIGGFGGDKDHMVLWGQSAGANAVVTYSYANPDDPIVTGLIADSGTASGSTSTNTSSFSMMASSLGCGNMSAAAELSCMQKVDALTIQNYVEGKSGGTMATSIGGTVADNVTVFSNNTERLIQGRVAKVPLITGVTRNEGAAFAPFTLNQTVAPSASTLIMLNGNIVCSVDAEANNRAAHNLTIYRYLFSGNFSNITPRYWLGAMHSSELPVVFGTHDLFRGNSTELEWQTSYAMQALWISFVANSSTAPVDPAGLAWPKYTGRNGSMIVFGNETARQIKPVTSMNEVYPLDGTTCGSTNSAAAPSAPESTGAARTLAASVTAVFLVTFAAALSC